MDILKKSCITECGPGKYKSKINAKNSYCETINQGNDACVTCPGQTVKTGYGNSQSLCVNSCDGITNVSNDGHFACSKLSTLYEDLEII